MLDKRGGPCYNTISGRRTPVNKEDAIKLFRAIQNGRGTGDFKETYAETLPRGCLAERVWHNSEFSYGIEYGILIALSKVFELTTGDI